MTRLASKQAWELREYDKPLITGSYFGFTPITPPKLLPVDFEASSHCLDIPYFDAPEKAALIRTYTEHNFANLPHPLALIYKRPARKSRAQGYSLHYIGAPGGIAEASLVRASLSILAEEGYKNLRVDLNCLGDKESMSCYERDLINYVKKFGGNISDEHRASLKEDVYNLFRSEDEAMIQLRANAPTSLSFLSSQSRLHFKEVLEFIEALNIEFSLAPELVGEKNHSSHTIFSIRPSIAEAEQTGSREFLAVGYRYSRLTKKLGMRKELPMAGVTIYIKDQAQERKIYKELPKPKFYLVQLGREAKIRTLNLIEMLRANRIPVHHFIGKDKLTAQLMSAEALRVPYLIIIGQKEALDGTATIRNMSTRAQDTIPMEALAQYLKNISL